MPHPSPALRRIASAVVRCERCPRLRAHCRRAAREKRRAFREETYWGRPVPGFGDPRARVLIVGLAPAAHGANRTGRMFTGDRSGDFLFAALYRAGFARVPHSHHRDDGQALVDAYLTAAVRCAPPENKPTTAEALRCRPFLEAELDALSNVRVLLALGRLAFDACLDLLRARGAHVHRAQVPFAHGAIYTFAPGLPLLAVSYHPSQQNTFTGRLTPRQLDAVLSRVRAHLKSGAS